MRYQTSLTPIWANTAILANIFGRSRCEWIKRQEEKLNNCAAGTVRYFGHMHTGPHTQHTPDSPAHKHVYVLRERSNQKWNYKWTLNYVLSFEDKIQFFRIDEAKNNCEIVGNAHRHRQ